MASRKSRRSKQPTPNVPTIPRFTTPLVDPAGGGSEYSSANVARGSGKPPSEKQIQFLAAYAICGLVGKAAKAAGCNRGMHGHWMIVDPDYPAKFSAAQDAANEMLEDEARRRAIHGVERMKFYKGQPIIDPRTGKPYIEHEYSDRMLELALKAHMHDKYAERSKVETTTRADLPAAVESLLMDPARIDAEIQANERHLLDDEPGGQLDPAAEVP